MQDQPKYLSKLAHQLSPAHKARVVDAVYVLSVIGRSHWFLNKGNLGKNPWGGCGGWGTGGGSGGGCVVF